MEYFHIYKTQKIILHKDMHQYKIYFYQDICDIHNTMCQAHMKYINRIKQLLFCVLHCHNNDCSFLHVKIFHTVNKTDSNIWNSSGLNEGFREQAQMLQSVHKEGIELYQSNIPTDNTAEACCNVNNPHTIKSALL